MGTCAGLVGAMAGVCGFLPHLLLCFSREYLHIIWPSFALLSFFSAALWRTNAVVFLAQPQTTELRLLPWFTRTADRMRAGVTATFFSGLLVAAVCIGSRNLQNFDAALVIYTFAVVFAT